MGTKEENNTETKKVGLPDLESLSHLERQKIADSIAQIAMEAWIISQKKEPGDLEILKNKDGKFEGAVRLLQKEKWHPEWDPIDYPNTAEWDRPVGHLVERWLVEWLRCDEINWEGKGDFDKGVYPANWFTQATMAGKKGHRVFKVPSRNLEGGVIDLTYQDRYK